MRAPENQIARLPEPLAHGLSGSDLGPFRGYHARAPFPRSGGGASGASRYGPRIELELEAGPGAAPEARAAVSALHRRPPPGVLDDVRRPRAGGRTPARPPPGPPGRRRVAPAGS